MIDLRHFAASMLTTSLGGDGGKQAGISAKKKTFGETFERVILLIHRWIGIVACLLFIMWFISGIVLTYVRFPSQHKDLAEELHFIKPIEWSKPAIGPEQAIQAVGLRDFPPELRLEVSAGAPIYRIVDWDKRNYAVSGITGKELMPTTGADALRIVQEQLDLPRATLARENFERDQWTVTGYWNHERPFHLISANDDTGTEYTVSAKTGEVLFKTWATQRFWNWLGAIPHWLYFSFIRHDGEKWTWTVDILASAGIFVAISGIWIGIKRIRLSRRYANGRRIPFSGWMRWHHILGLIGGLFLALWMISGLFTMYPAGMLEGRTLQRPDFENFAGTTAVSFPALDTNALSAIAQGVKRISFRHMAGRPVLALEDGVAPSHLLDAQTLQPIQGTSDSYRAAAAAILPDAKLTSLEWIEHGDEYWHTAFYKKKLPILRATFDNGIWFHIDPESADILGVLDETDRVARWSVVAIHNVDWFWLFKQRPLWDVVTLATLIPGLAISITALVIGFRRLRRTVEPAVSLAPVAGLDGGAFGDSTTDGQGSTSPVKAAVQRALVVYSSQTGTAEELAGQLQNALLHTGMAAEKRDLADTTPAQLAAEQLALFVVATTGEGDPPDKATAFLRRHMRLPTRLNDTAYAVVALGDTEYPKYCQFGRQVDAWLSQSGAKRLFPTALVDKGETASIDAWIRNLETSLDRQVHLERSETFTEWKLVRRECVNFGSVGAPIYRVILEPVDAESTWLPGDIARIEAGVDWASHVLGGPGTARDYSIASLPSEGHVSLFVRLTRKDDGTPGIGSGWLTNAPIGTSMVLRVRSNLGFHPASNEKPAIFIGNGTGYAGLRAHLLHRVKQGQHRNWLVFGERNRANDCICRDEVDEFTRKNMLDHCDLVFSRDQPRRRYVQDVIRERGAEILRWVRDGACIYICGNQQGMAPGVHAALTEVLGEELLQELAESGRYRRDVY